MYENEISNEELESVATRLIAKYPDGYLTEPELIMWEGWAVAIRGPDADGLDTPKATIRGSYKEIRAFELAYHRIRGAAKSSPLIDMADSRIALEAWNDLHSQSRRFFSSI